VSGSTSPLTSARVAAVQPGHQLTDRERSLILVQQIPPCRQVVPRQPLLGHPVVSVEHTAADHRRVADGGRQPRRDQALDGECARSGSQGDPDNHVVVQPDVVGPAVTVPDGFAADAKAAHDPLGKIHPMLRAVCHRATAPPRRIHPGRAGVISLSQRRR
jgi:hypothetical protein